MTLGFIGFGLIGGSIAKGLKKKDASLRILAYSLNPSELEAAQEDGLVNIVLDSAVSPKLSECDIVFLCAPVEENLKYLPQVAPLLKEGAVLTDVSSTKEAICEAAKALEIRSFIGGHPMAGSEQSGYSASTDYLFSNAYYIITPVWEDARLTDTLKEVAEKLQAIPIIVDAKTHDDSIAAVSHLPHIVASTLVNLVKDHDNAAQTMKTLAAGGFRDITRIASSSPVMWQQICRTNAPAIEKILTDYIGMLQKVSDVLKKEIALENAQQTGAAEITAKNADSADAAHADAVKETIGAAAKDASAENSGTGNSAEKAQDPTQAIYEMFESSRDYRNSISAKNKGAITPDYSFSVDVADEVGAISTISVILASKGISIKNIGINNARDHGEGALRIAFYEEDAKELAKQVLKRYQYDIR